MLAVCRPSLRWPGLSSPKLRNPDNEQDRSGLFPVTATPLKVAEVVAEGAGAALLVRIDAEGNLSEAQWAELNAADAIIFGAPTCMGNAPWQFKKFADASSKVWFTRGWQDKVFGGFVNSASLNGDKQVTLPWLQTLVSQHGGIWVSLGLPPANALASTRQDVNNLGAVRAAGRKMRRPQFPAAFAFPAERSCRLFSVPDQSRATWKPAKDWLTGISSMRLMFRCGGSVATQKIVSAMSSAVIGRAPE